MRSKLLILIAGAFLAVISFPSCQKETEQGPPGPKGDTGVANVIYSDWIDVQYGWVVPSPGDTLGLGGVIDAPKLTADIVNKGSVKVYFNLGSTADPYVTTLPYIDQISELIVTPYVYPGKIELLANGNAGTYTDGGVKYNQYRYVLIPGGVLAAKPANVNLDNYAEARKYLKIN